MTIPLKEVVGLSLILSAIISALSAAPLPIKDGACRQLVGETNKELSISEDDCKVVVEFFRRNGKTENEHHLRTTSWEESEPISVDVGGLSVEVTFIDQNNGQVFAQISTPDNHDEHFIQEVEEFLKEFWVILNRPEELIFEIDSTNSPVHTTLATTTKEPTPATTAKESTPATTTKESTSATTTKESTPATTTKEPTPATTTKESTPVTTTKESTPATTTKKSTPASTTKESTPVTTTKELTPATTTKEPTPATTTKKLNLATTTKKSTTTTKTPTTTQQTNISENSVASSSFSTTSDRQKPASGDTREEDGNGSTSAKPTFLMLFISVGIFLYSSM